MILYHGTSNIHYEEILEQGFISNYPPDQYDDTLTLDEILEEHLDYSLSEGAIFLTDDENMSEYYPKVFEINIEELNKAKLYIVDLDLAQEIYNNFHKGKDVSKLVEKYEEQLMCILDAEELYENTEFLYFDDIPIKETNNE